MVPAQPSSALSPPWPGSDAAAPGIPGAAGMAWRDWRWRAACPSCGEPLVPTGPQSPVRIFSNHAVLAGAPLRNRTVVFAMKARAARTRDIDDLRLLADIIGVDSVDTALRICVSRIASGRADPATVLSRQRTCPRPWKPTRPSTAANPAGPKSSLYSAAEPAARPRQACRQLTGRRMRFTCGRRSRMRRGTGVWSGASV